MCGAANPAGGLEPGPTEAGDLPSALVTEGTTGADEAAAVAGGLLEEADVAAGGVLGGEVAAAEDPGVG